MSNLKVLHLLSNWKWTEVSEPAVDLALAQKNLVEEVKSGLVHKEKDAAEIAEKILILFRDPDLSKMLGMNGKKFIEEKFCWEKVSGNLKELYLEFEKS